MTEHVTEACHPPRFGIPGHNRLDPEGVYEAAGTAPTDCRVIIVQPSGSSPRRSSRYSGSGSVPDCACPTTVWEIPDRHLCVFQVRKSWCMSVEPLTRVALERAPPW